ncbi:DUF3168 domain-containing protein [Cypionkella sp.]|uniref:DUF3168 domain-containing protein n=1 Tax=Cypionkella sp. TaxID=2811411 RepID=UPI0026063586|nr:DUF3168 domain-containing protein [Cypionkella sp.]
MLEPTLAFQDATAAALVASPEVLALVPVAHIRAGSTRPDKTPCIILAGAQTEYLGRAPVSQHVARVFLDLHIWAIEDGAETAKAIGMAVLQALIDAPAGIGFAVDEYAKPRTIWMRDPQPDLAYTHGVMTLEAVIRWGF